MGGQFNRCSGWWGVVWLVRGGMIVGQHSARFELLGPCVTYVSIFICLPTAPQTSVHLLPPLPYWLSQTLHINYKPWVSVTTSPVHPHHLLPPRNPPSQPHQTPAPPTMASSSASTTATLANLPTATSGTPGTGCASARSSPQHTGM